MNSRSAALGLVLLTSMAVSLPLLAQGSAPRQLERSLEDSLQRYLRVSEKPRLEIWLRALRSASASDRERLRQEMIGAGRWRVPELLGALRSSRNQLIQRQLLLVLMELGDPRSRRLLEAIASGRIRGVEGNAGLALGRIGGERAFGALSGLCRSANKLARVQGALAIGRLRHPRSASALLEQLGKSRSLARRGNLLGLALSGGATVSALERYLGGNESRDEALRRTATLALGTATGEGVEERLFAIARKDRDARCRSYALEGLAARGAKLDEDALIGFRMKPTDDLLRARITLLAGQNGSVASWSLIHASARHRDGRVRIAAASAAALHAGPEAPELLTRLLGDGDQKVRQAALCSSALLAGRSSRRGDFLSFVGKRDEVLARIAVAALVYQGEKKGREGLEAVVQNSETPKSLRKTVKDWLEQLDANRPVARQLARFELQVALDRLGAAPSWNHCGSLNRVIEELLHLEDARSSLGGGTTPTGANRAGAAVARRHTKEQEDLKYHFDRYPYADRPDDRPIEMPPPPGS